MLNRQGRPSSAGEAGTTAHPTFTGNKALAQVEPLLFEIGRYDTTGVDLDEPEDFQPRLGEDMRMGKSRCGNGQGCSQGRCRQNCRKSVSHIRAGPA